MNNHIAYAQLKNIKLHYFKPLGYDNLSGSYSGNGWLSTEIIKEIVETLQFDDPNNAALLYLACDY